VAVQSADALRKSIARGDRGGVFFLHGDEEYLKDEVIQVIIKAHLDPATRDFNLDELRAQGLDPETLASITQTPPLLSEWRVVIVREAQALAASSRMRSVVELLVERNIPGLALVFAGQVADRKARFWQMLEKKARTVDFATLPQSELPDWLIERAHNNGVTLEAGAARALAAAAGPELGRLIRELDKLADFVAARKRISADDVRNLVGHIPHQNRWDWFDRIGEARFADARRTLPVLLEDETAVGLVIGLGSHLLRVGIARTGGERVLADALPPHQRWLASRIAKQARNWSAHELDAALDDLLRADRLLKSASLDERQVMEELLLRFEGRHKAAA
jgi:DNA polymerase-3 subunit delta